MSVAPLSYASTFGAVVFLADLLRFTCVRACACMRRRLLSPRALFCPRFAPATPAILSACPRATYRVRVWRNMSVFKFPDRCHVNMFLRSYPGIAEWYEYVANPESTRCE
mgnify:CR=1 FL=1